MTSRDRAGRRRLRKPTTRLRIAPMQRRKGERNDDQVCGTSMTSTMARQDVHTPWPRSLVSQPSSADSWAPPGQPKPRLVLTTKGTVIRTGRLAQRPAGPGGLSGMRRRRQKKTLFDGNGGGGGVRRKKKKKLASKRLRSCDGRSDGQRVNAKKRNVERLRNDKHEEPNGGGCEGSRRLQPWQPSESTRKRGGQPDERLGDPDRRSCGMMKPNGGEQPGGRELTTKMCARRDEDMGRRRARKAAMCTAKVEGKVGRGCHRAGLIQAHLLGSRTTQMRDLLPSRRQAAGRERSGRRRPGAKQGGSVGEPGTGTEARTRAKTSDADARGGKPEGEKNAPADRKRATIVSMAGEAFRLQRRGAAGGES